jgi:alpha-amylase
MPTVVLHFDFHLPLRLKKYGFFDIGRSREYFDAEESLAALERYAEGFALPAAARMLQLVRRHRGRFRVSLAVSGMLLEQLEKGQKPLLESFRRLADTGCAEMVCGVSHHSLASFFSEAEFRLQVALHRRAIRARFGQMPRAFRNTEGICDDRVARVARSMGFRVILAGGAGRLSDETMSQDAEAFAKRLVGGYHGDEVIGLVIDCGGFAEGDPGRPGVLRFLETVPGYLLKRRNWSFLTPSEAAARHGKTDFLDTAVPSLQSDPGNDRADCLGNHLQRDVANTLYAMEGRVRQAGSRRLLDTWRKLQASDYMEYLCTKGLSEGARGRTPTPFASPYDAYIHTMNILKDFSGRIGGKSGVRP